jgi:N-acetylmuramoyl-L-alanine amidase
MEGARRLAHELTQARYAARRALRFWWTRADREAMAFALMMGSALLVFSFAVHGVLVRHERALEAERAQERRSLECLALNVYHEARGEPPEGQYAVAEVTLNRKASPRFPDTVCDVVYEQRWDAIRERHVGGFSWTEFYSVPDPEGEAWALARRIAEDVYHRRVPPRVDGALFYHATYIRPSWAKHQKRVARIGRHVFYR